MDASVEEMPGTVIADLKNGKYLAVRHRMWDLFLQRRARESASVLLRRQLMH